jgi:hypothetical protein
MKKVSIILIAILIANITFAQTPKYRPDITSLTGPQQTALAGYMQQYITAQIIEDHCNVVMHGNIHPGHDIHDDINFMPFHRAYIEGMEDFIKLHATASEIAIFIPLPAWDPGTSCPNAFRVIDADVANVLTSDIPLDVNGNPLPAVSTCLGNVNMPTNWTPLARPRFLKQPTLSGSNDDLCDWTNGIGANSFTEVAEGEQDVNGITYHNDVHVNMTGIMRNFKSPALLAFWIWHAYLDDIWKEYQCECTNQNANPKLMDLYMKNSKEVLDEVRDLGVEPNDDQTTWNSPDIWVRNDNTGLVNDETQNPEYSATIPVSVYVRVRNRNCSQSLGTENLKLYWAKAGTYHNWPAPWDGVAVNSPAQVIGGLISTKLIPILQDGEQTILKFDWLIPNPTQFGSEEWDVNNDGIPDAWHFCLLARIEASNDADGVVIAGADITTILQGSNNFVLRNTAVVNFLPGKPGGGIVSTDKLNNATIAVGNLYAVPTAFKFTFESPKNYKFQYPITHDADIIITLNPLLWNLFINGGSSMENAIIYNEAEKQIKLIGNKASINNITFLPNQLGALNISFNFLSDVQSSRINYDLRVAQIRQSDSKVVGGEMYSIKKPIRGIMTANAGSDKTIIENQSTIIEGNLVGENAIYNWYDENGILIHTGKDFTVSPEVTKKYKLELIAQEDGFKDYDEVLVNVKENYISAVSPNPAIDNITINYKLKDASSAYIIISQPYGASNNYIINVTDNNKSVNISNYMTGFYNVSLVKNGQIVDVKSFTKQ